MSNIKEIRQTAIYKHLEKMLTMAEEAENKGELDDGNKTIASIKETMERLEQLEQLEWLKQLGHMEPEAQDIDFLGIIANIKCCENFPCVLLRLLLIHNDPETRSLAYRTFFECCADAHLFEPLTFAIDRKVLFENCTDEQLLSIVIAKGVRGSKKFGAMGYFDRTELRGILGL